MLNEKLLTVAYDRSSNTCRCCRMNLDKRVTHHLLRFVFNVGGLQLLELLCHPMASAWCKHIRAVSKALWKKTLQISLFLLWVHFFHFFLISIGQLFHKMKIWFLLLRKERRVLITEFDWLCFQIGGNLPFCWQGMQHCVLMCALASWTLLCLKNRPFVG